MMSLLFARRTASPVEDDDWVFVHEETCGIPSYKDAVLARPVADGSSDSRECLIALEDTLNNENSRLPRGGKHSKKKRR